MLKEMNLGLVRMNESGNQIIGSQYMLSKWERNLGDTLTINGVDWRVGIIGDTKRDVISALNEIISCLLYTSPSPRDATLSRMPSSA